MSPQAHHIRRLATALTAGAMEDREALMARAKPLVGDLGKARWLASLARKLSLEFSEAPRPTVRRIAERIRAHEGFVNAWADGRGRISIGQVTPQMAPAAGAPRTWAIPEIATLGDLADMLRLHPDDLGWLISRSSEHYRHRWQAKPKGGRFRLIESPKVLLKFAQRQVLRKILHAIPPHEAARGFRAGCSVLDFVEPHTGKEILIRLDLEDFFPSITASRVLQIFMTAGYPESVARALTRLTTHGAPSLVLDEKTLTWPERRRLATPHLPQGDPDELRTPRSGITESGKSPGFRRPSARQAGVGALHSPRKGSEVAGDFRADRLGSGCRGEARHGLESGGVSTAVCGDERRLIRDFSMSGQT